jgi:hypothetical protein
MRRWRCVVVESPFAGDVVRNLEYLCAAMRDCLFRGEAPFASHGLYTQALDDKKAVERELGIAAGLAWGDRADACVVYTDLGISPGMQRGIEHAEANGCPVEYRELGDAWRAPRHEPPFSVGDVVIVSGETPLYRVVQIALDGDPHGYRVQLEPVARVDGKVVAAADLGNTIVVPAWRCRRIPRPEGV